MSSNLTQERLHSLLDYDPETGAFTWKVRRSGTARAGSIAGTIFSGGYLGIRVDGRAYKAHRLAFLWMNGVFPSDQVDHRNGVRDDNRWSNLREVTQAENQQNIGTARRHNRSSGLLGAWRHRDKWRSKIWFGGKQIHVGSFSTAEEAHAAYLKAKDELHPTHSRLRKKP